MTKSSSALRQEWLEKSYAQLVPVFKAAGFAIPAKVRVSWGFPGGGSARKRIGECWHDVASSDKHREIFISPVLGGKGREVRILGVLAHEMAHTLFGPDEGHGRNFKKAATSIGLEGKMTATVEGDLFKQHAKKIVAKVGKFPAGSLELSGRKKQTTRLIKCECQECGYTVRTTRKWIEAAGAPICPVDEVQMSSDYEPGEEDDGE